MKHTIDIPTNGRAYFKVLLDDPVFEPLADSGYYFVNPRCTSTVQHPMGTADYQVIQTQKLVFASDAEPDFNRGLPVVRAFLSHVRPLSMQVAFPIKTVPSTGYLPHEIVLPPWPQFGGTAYTRADWIRTALTFETVRYAVRMMSEQPDLLIPNLMLDAIEAWNREDHRRAIVFAAIAMEAQAQIAIDAAVEEKQLDASGSRSVADPVYSLLRGRQGIRYRLHELPLYAFGQSLMEHNKRAYDNALTLYATRNKIVHTGTVPGNAASVFPVTSDGAKQAIAAAGSVVRWFGLTLDYEAAIDDSTIFVGGTA